MNGSHKEGDSVVRSVLLSISVLCMLFFVSCAERQTNRGNLNTNVFGNIVDDIPHCTGDRRPSYIVLEMPPIRNVGDVPPVYMEMLYDAIQKQIEKRLVWRVVSSHNTIKDVVVFNVSILAWENIPDALDREWRMKMQLSLVDKFLGCEVNETLGEGNVVMGSSGDKVKSGVSDVADGAGWFVENVLIHNQFN